MKNPIKFLFVGIVVVLATNSYSQTVGFKAGLNLSKMLMKDNRGNYTDNYELLPGFVVGGIVEFPINKVLSFEPELLFSTKGYKSKERETTEYYLKLYYLDIPLNAKAKFELGGTKIYGTFGPYLGIGLIGKSKYETIINGQLETGNDDINWGSSEGDNLKRFDFGLAFGAGVEIKSFRLGISYELGLTNLSVTQIDGSKISNRVLGISFGYKILGK